MLGSFSVRLSRLGPGKLVEAQFHLVHHGGDHVLDILSAHLKPLGFQRREENVVWYLGLQTF